MTIKEAENVLKEIMNEEDDRFQLLMKDERKGVQKLVLKWYKQKELEQKEKENFFEMSKYENALREKGVTYIAGIDEVGRDSVGCACCDGSCRPSRGFLYSRVK